MRISLARESSSPMGKSMDAVPRRTIACPRRTRWASANFVINRPFKARPAVMSIKNMLAKYAAVSTGTSCLFDMIISERKNCGRAIFEKDILERWKKQRSCGKIIKTVLRSVRWKKKQDGEYKMAGAVPTTIYSDKGGKDHGR